jgi:hypothetical protein
LFRHTWSSWARRIFIGQEAEAILGHSPLVNRGYGGIVGQAVAMETVRRTVGMGMLEKMDTLMELMGLDTPKAYRVLELAEIAPEVAPDSGKGSSPSPDIRSFVVPRAGIAQL